MLICLGQNNLKGIKSGNTLAGIIKRKIRGRIYITLSIALLTPILVLIYSYYTAVMIFKDDIMLEMKTLADNVMGQYLVNNFEAIKLNILSFNKSHIGYQVSWQPQHKSAENTIFHYRLYNFEVIYPINNKISGENINAGTLTVNGTITLLIGKKIIMVIILCITICIFSFVLYLLLLPLVNDIPSTLILKPVQSLLKMMNGEYNYANDITTDKESYEEIRQIRQMISQLIVGVKQQEKNMAFIVIARKVIHDIKSPLRMALSCNGKILSNNYDINLNKKIGVALQNIHKQLSQLHGDIEEKKFLVAEKDDYPCYILIKDYLQNIIADKELELNYKINFIVDDKLNADSWCYIEPHTFINHISNLLNNAYEALHNKLSSGVLNVRLFNNNKEDNISVIEIEDNGIGIEDKLMDKIVDGYTTKAKGSGIGLSSAIKFFQDEGGKIVISSTPNVGTIVRVEVIRYNSPRWFIRQIKLKDYIVILDDDCEVHAYLQSVFYLVPEVKYFTKIEQFKQWYENNSNYTEAATYFIDNNIECGGKNGIDLIYDYGIAHNAYLITDGYDEGLLQQKVTKLNIKLLPKQLLQIIFQEL